MNKFSKAPNNETAKEAIDRLINYVNNSNLDDVKECGEESYFPVYDNTIDIDKLNKTFNQDFGVPLPKSYYNFVKENGFFKFGNTMSHKSLLVEPKNTLSQALRCKTGELGWDRAGGWSEDLSAICTDKEINRLNNLVMFSFGDEELQTVWYYCFDVLSYDNATQEMDIYPFSQDDWGDMFEDNEVSKSFDEHIVNLVNSEIFMIEDE